MKKVLLICFFITCSNFAQAEKPKIFDKINNALANPDVQNFITDMACGSTYDELSGRYMSCSEKQKRDEALLKQGTSYEQLIMQKRQNEELNQNLMNINQSIQRLSW